MAIVPRDPSTPATLVSKYQASLSYNVGLPYIGTVVAGIVKPRAKTSGNVAPRVFLNASMKAR